MAKKEQKYEWGNTNAAELFQAWKDSEEHEEVLDEYFSASLDFFRQCVEGISKEAGIPAIRFAYADNTISEMQYAFHSFPCTMNICLTGKDNEDSYLILISWDLDEDGAPGRYCVYPHRIRRDGSVEVYFEEEDEWGTVDPEIIKMFKPGSRDEGTYSLFRSLEGLGIVPPTYMSTEEVEKVISDNEKMLSLYKEVSTMAVIVADDQVASSLIEGVVPISPYAQRLIVFQVAQKLILGCVAGVDDENPKTAKLVAIYATESVEKMTQILKILGAPAEMSASDYPEVWSGDLISMEPEEE